MERNNEMNTGASRPDHKPTMPIVEGPATVLVVAADDAFTGKVINRIRDAGHRCETAATLDEARMALQSGEVDLVLVERFDGGPDLLQRIPVTPRARVVLVGVVQVGDKPDAQSGFRGTCPGARLRASKPERAGYQRRRGTTQEIPSIRPFHRPVHPSLHLISRIRSRLETPTSTEMTRSRAPWFRTPRRNSRRSEGSTR